MNQPENPHPTVQAPDDAQAGGAPEAAQKTLPPPRTGRNLPLSGKRKVRLPSWFDLFDPRQPEAFLAFCSLWCSAQLWIWPNQFAIENPLVTLAIGLRGHEKIWAMYGIVASLLKVFGLASRMSPRWLVFSAGMRASGLFMSIIFWMIIGLSLVLDFPHSITPIALTGLGVAAVFELAVKRDPRETWR